MGTREFFYKLSGNKVALLIGQIFSLIVCISYFDYIYYFNIYPDKKVQEDFTQTNCLVVSKNLGTKGRFVHKYRANFLIAYEFSGVSFTRWVSGNGLDMSYSKNQAEQEAILSQFNEGNSYPCWVDPEKPITSVLVLRQHWLTTMPLLLPSLIILIVLYYFFKTISLMLAERRDRKL